MNKLILGNCGDAIIYNPEIDSVSVLECAREGIRSIHVVREPMQLVVKTGKNDFTKEVHPGDIIIRFYESTFPHSVIVINSNEWMENFDSFEKYIQDSKKANLDSKCEPCDNAEQCIR